MNKHDDDFNDTGAVNFDLEKRTEQISAIAAWKEQLEAEHRRAEVLLEAGLLTDEHMASLAHRTRLFLDACRAMTPKERK